MRWLADENIQDVIIERLRAAGEDMLTVAEIDLSATDPAVVEHAQVHNRLLLTADKDFGRSWLPSAKRWERARG